MDNIQLPKREEPEHPQIVITILPDGNIAIRDTGNIPLMTFFAAAALLTRIANRTLDNMDKSPSIQVARSMPGGRFDG